MLRLRGAVYRRQKLAPSRLTPAGRPRVPRRGALAAHPCRICAGVRVSRALVVLFVANLLSPMETKSLHMDHLLSRWKRRGLQMKSGSDWRTKVSFVQYCDDNGVGLLQTALYIGVAARLWQLRARQLQEAIGKLWDALALSRRRAMLTWS